MAEPNERPPIAQAPLSVVLFAQALSTETSEALQSWRHYLDSLHRPYEIVLIEEARPDVPPAPRHELPGVRTIAYDRAAGFREALNEAFHSAQYPLLAQCTCDGQYLPNDLDGMLKVIDEVDLVVGYRVGRSIPFWRLLLDTILMVLGRVVIGVSVTPTQCWLGSKGWSRRWVARWVFGLRVNDPECPFRLARREIFQRIPVQSRGPFAPVEILAKANHLSCLIAEEPVTWTPPDLPPSDAISFWEDAGSVFRDPHFVPASPPAATEADGIPLTQAPGSE